MSGFTVYHYGDILLSVEEIQLAPRSILNLNINKFMCGSRNTTVA